MRNATMQDLVRQMSGEGGTITGNIQGARAIAAEVASEPSVDDTDAALVLITLGYVIANEAGFDANLLIRQRAASSKETT